jgi:hypothetical protein
MRYLITAMLILIAISTSVAVALPATERDAPRISRWFQNYDGAVSLRFDDNLESHRTEAIPLLNRYGFRAVFMVSPGTQRYRSDREFWEQQVPAMGHRLGNHTMNHHGGRDIADAEYEIGEAAQIIRRAYPRESEVLVFASGGGGKQWGGRLWEQADPAYHQIVKTYHLIDLYDGKFMSFRGDSSSSLEKLCMIVDQAVDQKAHRAFHFHGIGKPTLLDRLKALVRGIDLTTSEENFSGLLRCLTKRRERLWVAPLIDILKYEKEAQNASVTVSRPTPQGYTLLLTVQTDPNLYDHKLTMVLPVTQGRTIKRIIQDNEERDAYQRIAGEVLVDVKPVNSAIQVRFN